MLIDKHGSGLAEDPNYSVDPSSFLNRLDPKIKFSRKLQCMCPRSTKKISILFALELCVCCGYVEGSMMTCKMASGFVFVGILICGSLNGLRAQTVSLGMEYAPISLKNLSTPCPY